VSDAPATLVEVEAASVRFGDQEALRAVDLVVRRGEIVSLIGPNGAGKSTLVRLILGVLTPSSGRISRMQGLRVAYVPQRLQIDPTLPITVGRFLDLPDSRPPQAKYRALEEVGVGGLENRAMQDLSGGEFQRVLLARALLRDPDLFVLDEPWQGVDVAGQAELFRLIARVRQTRGCAILLVSHDLHLVMAWTDRVICLHRHVCCTGSPEVVSSSPAFQALFGAGIADAFAVYRHRHDHEHTLSGEIVVGAEPEPHIH
jgi:zinc transport system ATP-binding protein